MPWFKVDDGFTTSDKVIAIPRKERIMAIGLWTYAGNYAARHLTNGFVPLHMLDDIDAPQESIDHLVRVGLWDTDENAGYWFHDWCDYQPSAEAHKAKLEARSAAGRVGGLKSAEAKAKQKSTKNEAKVNPEPEPEPEPTTPKGVVKRGTQLSEDFEITDAMRAWASEKHPNVNIEKQTANFIDYWLSKPKDNTMLDWNRTWQRWIRNSQPESRTVAFKSKQEKNAEAGTKFLEAFAAPQNEITQNPDWA